MSKGIIATIVVLGLLVVGGISLFGYVNGIQKEGVAQEQALNAQYQSSQLELDTYTKKILESVGLADRKSDKLAEVLKAAVAGRYEGEVKPGQGGAFFSAITEAYPNIDLSIYDRIVDMVNAGREAFKQKQNQLRDQIRVYETWMYSGIVQSRVIAMVGYPSNQLEARIGTRVVTGRDALSQMKVLVTSKGTSEAFQTGEQEAIDINGKNKK
jgi:hypothetical protein